MLTHFSPVADGPGKWLLDPRIQATFDTKPVLVRFRVEYDGGRWVTRTAKTLKSWFITETLLLHKVALDMTDQRGNRITRRVEVQFLLPTKPQLDHPAIIIDGPNIGDVGMVKGRNRRTKDFTIDLVDSAARVQLPEEALCRLTQSES
jgi:hypothetical protein